MALYVAPRIPPRLAPLSPHLVVGLGRLIDGAAPQQDPQEPPPKPDDGKPPAPSAAAETPGVSGGVYALTASLFVIGLVVGTVLLKEYKGLSYTPAEGIGAFALFYVVAQASERVVELLVLPALEKVSAFDKPAAKKDLEVAVAAVNNGGGTARKAAKAQAKVDGKTLNRATAAFGASGGLGMILCGYLHANFLVALGVSTPDHWVSDAIAILVTGAAVGGGSKQLHDLITNVSKSSDKKDKPAETGGDT